MAYQATGLLSAGIARQIPETEKARHGLYAAPKWSGQTPALILWVDLFGVHKGDRQEFVLYGPDGRKLMHKAKGLPKSQVSWFAYAGLRRPNQGWQEGTYKGVYLLIREGRSKIRVSRTVTLK